MPSTFCRASATRVWEAVDGFCSRRVPTVHAARCTREALAEVERELADLLPEGPQLWWVRRLRLRLDDLLGCWESA